MVGSTVYICSFQVYLQLSSLFLDLYFDLAPSDHYLFPKMKKELNGYHFGSKIISAVDHFLWIYH